MCKERGAAFGNDRNENVVADQGCDRDRERSDGIEKDLQLKTPH